MIETFTNYDVLHDARATRMSREQMSHELPSNESRTTTRHSRDILVGMSRECHENQDSKRWRKTWFVTHMCKSHEPSADAGKTPCTLARNMPNR